jgi:hypothetical protein
MMNYYFLITGLPDIEIEDNKLVFTVADFKKEVAPHLWNADKWLFDLFFMKFDNQNLLNYIKDKEAVFDERGNISKEEMEVCFKQMNENIKPKNRYFKTYIQTFVSHYLKTQSDDIETITYEKQLTELYYQWAMHCGNPFIEKWFEFNLNLNNILAAVFSRKYQINSEVVGNNAVANLIKTSNQRDFGLAEILEESELFFRITEESDLFEREKRIDLMKWDWLEEQTFFKYFGIECVFSYLLKLDIIERWVSIDPVKGKKIFRILIDNLKQNAVNHPELSSY